MREGVNEQDIRERPGPPIEPGALVRVRESRALHRRILELGGRLEYVTRPRATVPGADRATLRGYVLGNGRRVIVEEWAEEWILYEQAPGNLEGAVRRLAHLAE